MKAEDSIKTKEITRGQVVETALMEALMNDDLALTETYAHSLLEEHLEYRIQSQLQALKKEVENLYNKSVEEVENLSNEDPIVFSKGKRNALNEVLNLISNLEE